MAERTTWQESGGGVVPVTETYDEPAAPAPSSAAEPPSAAPPRRRASSAARRSPSPRPAVNVVREAGAGAAAGISVNKVQARKLVLVSVFVLAAVNIYHEQKGGTQVGYYRRLWGTGVVAVFLAIMADFAPQVAGPLALVIVLSQLPTKGNEALTAILSGAPPGLTGPVGRPSTATTGRPPGVTGPAGTQTQTGREAPGVTR